MFKKLCVTIFVACGFFTVMDIQADASHRKDPGAVMAPTQLNTATYSKSTHTEAEAIAKGLAKYPGCTFVRVRDTGTVWIVFVKC